MKSQAKKAIALSGGAAILVLAVGFGGDLPPRPTTTTATTHTSSIALAFRSQLLSQDVSYSTHLGDVTANVVAGPDLVGQAPTGGPPCVSDSTNPCPPAVGDSSKLPRPPRTRTVCRPAGIFGQHCFRRIVL